MIFPERSVMLALGAIHNGGRIGGEFSLLEDGTMAVESFDGTTPIHGHDLAALVERGWIVLGLDRDDGIPESINLTDQGRYALSRYFKKAKL